MGFVIDKYYTVLNAANCISGYEVDDGLNDFKEDNIKISFVTIQDIFAFIDKGPCFREVVVPNDIPLIDINTSNILREDGTNVDIFSSNKLFLGPVEIWTPENIIKLINNGAQISVDNYKIVKWSLLYNFKIFYFLQEYICAQDEDLWGYIINELSEEGLI